METYSESSCIVSLIAMYQKPNLFIWIKVCFWLQSRDITLPTKIHIVKAMVFPTIWMCERWTIKKPEHQRIDDSEFVVLEKTLESPLDSKEIKPVNPEGNQSWIFIGRTDAETEAPILWPRDAKSWLPGKDSDAGKNWGQEEKGATEDEIATDSMDMSLRKLREIVKGTEAWHATVHGVSQSRIRLND